MSYLKDYESACGRKHIDSTPASRWASPSSAGLSERVVDHLADVGMLGLAAK